MMVNYLYKEAILHTTIVKKRLLLVTWNHVRMCKLFELDFDT